MFNKGKNLEIYNIGTSEKVKISHLAQMISKIYKKNFAIYVIGIYL